MKLGSTGSVFFDSLIPTKRRLMFCGLLSTLFSLLTVSGYSFKNHGSAAVLFANRNEAAITAVVVCLCSAGYLFLILLLFRMLSDHTVRSFRQLPEAVEVQKTVSRNSTGSVTVTRYYTLIATLVIFLCYLPILILLYPGNVPHDGYNQINQFMGITPVSNGHPLFSTVIMGSFFALGRSLVDDNFGVFFYVFIQSLALACVFAKTSQTIRDFGYPRFAWICVAFFGVCPIWPIYGATFIKDTLFLIFFMVFCLLTVKLLLKQSGISIKMAFGITVVSLLVCWTRHTGVYVVIPTLLFLFFASNKSLRKQIAAVFISVLGIVTIWSGIIFPLLGVSPSPMNEMMSIPYQQTARYVIMHSGEITDVERAAIGTSIDYDRIPELYNPELSDPIKWSISYDGHPTTEYLNSWFEMFFKHPLTYLSATFHNTYGYYYPFANFDVMRSFQLYTKGDPVATGAFDIHYTFGSSTTNEVNNDMADQAAPAIVESYVSIWRNLPIIRLFTRPGTYAWLLAIAIVFAVDTKQYRKLVALMPPVLLLLACMVSPVNGLLRYAMPYMAASIITVVFATKNNRQKGGAGI